MRSVIVVIADVLRHQLLQVSFVEHNDVVEQVPSAVADPSLCNPILPRAAEAGSLGFDAEGLDCADDFFVKVRAAIPGAESSEKDSRSCWTTTHWSDAW
jgi:hypothetical protein